MKLDLHIFTFFKNLKPQQAKSVKSYHTDAREDLLIKFEDVVFMPYYVQLAYLLNPYLVASCAAKTTTGNFFKDTTRFPIETLDY